MKLSTELILRSVESQVNFAFSLLRSRVNFAFVAVCFPRRTVAFPSANRGLTTGVNRRARSQQRQHHAARSRSRCDKIPIIYHIAGKIRKATRRVRDTKPPYRRARASYFRRSFRPPTDYESALNSTGVDLAGERA